MHFVCRGRVLNELDEVVLEHDLARAHGKVASDRESGEVGLTDTEKILRLLEILNEMRHALHQILGVGRECGAHHLRVGQREV